MPGGAKDSLQTILAANVRRLRVAAGMTQESLAARVGISGVYLSRIETANANCSLQILEALAAALMTSAAKLITRHRT